MRVDAYENRIKLLTACRDVIGHYGTTAVTVKEIVNQAGLSSATFFRHFGSKDAVSDGVSINRCTILEFHARRPLNTAEQDASWKLVVRLVGLLPGVIT